MLLITMSSEPHIFIRRRSINYVTLTFIATRGGEFAEVTVNFHIFLINSRSKTTTLRQTRQQQTQGICWNKYSKNSKGSEQLSKGALNLFEVAMDAFTWY